MRPVKACAVCGLGHQRPGKLCQLHEHAAKVKAEKVRAAAEKQATHANADTPESKRS